MKKGVLCISIDTELLWGRWDKNYQPFIERTKKERAVIRNLLSLFKKYQIPVTWAVVGNLFLEQKNKDAKLWSGKDIIKLIQENKIHEIASHSFSHIEFDKATKDEAESEISKSVKIARENNVNLTSFVFPRNKTGHLRLLKKYGFKSFRGPDKRIWELISPTIPPVYEPYIQSGLVVIPGSMYFVSTRGMKKYIPPNLRFLKAKLGIENAIKNKKVFHLWTHPIDLVDNNNQLLCELEKILIYATEKKTQGQLEIKNMGEIAQDFNN
ncbi:MAG: polysaccharide deacetylase family protein [Candidatus Daviesbacteria bacterium]|nr:MAG: polysaccharide deacetylase family protein [Candidatus Daviesbacteria bacterium]